MRLSWTPERLAQAKEVVERFPDYGAAADELSKRWKVKLRPHNLLIRLREHGLNPDRLETSVPPPLPDKPELTAWQRYKPKPGLIAAPDKPAKLSIAKTEHWLVVPDVHHPYADRLAWACALGLAKELRPQRGIIIGDFLDLESLSRHPRCKPDLAKLASEIYAGNLALDALQGASPTTRWDFLEGNHEDRARKYANEYGQLDGLLSIPEQLFISPPGNGYHRASLGNLRQMGWIGLQDQPFICNSGLAFSHGLGYEAKHFTSMIATDHPGRVTFSGHMHTFQQSVGKTGGISQCCGFLGDEHAPVFDYATKRGAKRTGWQHGCVVLEVCDSGVSWTCVPFVRGRAIYGGKSILAKAA